MAQLSLAWIMSQDGIYFSTVIFDFFFWLTKYKVYRHPLLERPLLKTYVISLVCFYFNTCYLLLNDRLNKVLSMLNSRKMRKGNSKRLTYRKLSMDIISKTRNELKAKSACDHGH